MVKIWNLLNLRASLLICFTLTSYCLVAQEVEDYPDLYSDFSVDHLGNLYTLFEGDILTKLVEESNFEIIDYNYSNRSLGEITNFDVSNPLKIIVNHESFSTLVLLDVTLRETAQIYLPELQIFSNPVAYCLANDNTVWLYDDINLEFVRVNELGEKEHTSQNLVQQLGYTPQITSIKANKDYLLAVDAQKGFLVFDSFGTFIRRILVENVEQFQLQEDSILLAEGEKIYAYSLEGIGKEVIADLPEDSYKFIIQNKQLYFLTSLGVGQIALD